MTQLIRAGRETGYGAGALLFCPDTQRFLFIKRSDTGDHAGTWCCPGGGVEEHETVEEAVRRECEEEIGYRPEGELLHMNRDAQDGGQFIFHNHFCLVPEEFEPVLNPEHTDFVWSEEPPEPLHPGLANSMREWAGRQGVSV